MGLNIQEAYLPAQWVRQVGGLTQYQCEVLGKKYDYARQTDKGYPIGGLMKALNEELTALSKTMGTSIGANEKELQIEYELKRENVLSKQINNQAKLSLLIPKEEASDRVRNVFRATINMIKNAIKNAAPRLVGCEEKRDAERIMIEEHNDALEKLKSEAKVISWEEDGSSTLLRTRLAELDKTDPEFTDIIKNRSKSLNEGESSGSED